MIYLGRIPYGFFESQMKAYFAQFGEVVRLKLSRNKKTGKSKHYAFIEFAHPEVAEIVSETHNNMLLCDRIIKCSVVPVEKVGDSNNRINKFAVFDIDVMQLHPTMWHGSNKDFKPLPTKEIARKV